MSDNRLSKELEALQEERRAIHVPAGHPLGRLQGSQLTHEDRLSRPVHTATRKLSGSRDKILHGRKLTPHLTTTTPHEAKTRRNPREDSHHEGLGKGVVADANHQIGVRRSHDSIPRGTLPSQPVELPVLRVHTQVSPADARRESLRWLSPFAPLFS